MRTILVTGAAGFIGSHVCDRLLAEGERVVGVDDLSGGHEANLALARSREPAFEFQSMDVRSPRLHALIARRRPDVVMHLAAQSSVSLSVANPVRDASLNVMGLLNVLEGCAAAGTRKVVFAASGGTLYGTPRRIPVAEDARRNVGRVSPYGITKAVALEYLAFYRRHRCLTSTALALANVFGPRQDPLGEAGVVSIFGAQMLAGVRPTIFGGGRQTRDYVFVADVAEGFLRAADLADGQLVNIGTGRETDVNTIFRSLARIIGFRQSPLQGPWREGDIERTALDIRRARRVLDWRPQVSLREGLEATVAWLREAGSPAKGAG